MESDVTEAELTERPTAVVRGHVPHDGMAGFLGEAFGAVMGTVGRQGLAVDGPPFARYGMADDGGWDIEAGFPVSAPAAAEGPVEPSSLPGGRVARTLHVGPYAGVAAAYSALTAYLGEHGLVPTGGPWESYLDGPEVAMPRTEVCFPCRPA